MTIHSPGFRVKPGMTEVFQNTFWVLSVGVRGLDLLVLNAPVGSVVQSTELGAQNAEFESILVSS